MSDIGGSGPTAVGRLILDASGVQQGVQTAVGAVQNIGTVTGSTYFGLRNLGLGFEALGIAATGALGLAVESATSWESAMARIEVATQSTMATAGQATVPFSQVEAGLRGIAQTAPFTISQIEQVGTAVADAGIRGNTLISTTNTILQLNKVTGESFQELTSFLAKTAAGFGLSQSEVHAFGSALLAISQQSPAAISEIISLEQRTAAAGKAAGISATDLLGLNAAVASFPQFSRLAGSALTQLITGFGQAAAGNQALQRVIAETTNQSTTDFRNAYAVEPGKAIASFIEHLGTLKGGLNEQEAVLKALGITSSRAQDALIGVANAQGQLAGKAYEISNAIDTVNNEMERDALLNSEMGRISETTASKLEILHNNVTLAAQSFGSVLLPIITPVITAFTTMIEGLTRVPAPIQDIVIGMTLLTSVVGVVGGAFLILLPRILQGVSAIGTLRTAWQEAAASTAQAAAVNGVMDESMLATVDALMEVAAARGLDEEATQALIASQLELAGLTPEVAAGFAAATVAEGTAAGAMDVMTVSTTAFGLSLNLILPGITLLAAALGALGIFLYNQGNQVKDNTTANDQYANSDQSLIAALDRESQGVAFATNQWILHKLAIEGTLASLSGYNVNPSVTVGVVKGEGDPSAQLKDINSYMAAQGASSEAIRNVDTSLSKLNNTYQDSVAARNALINADTQLGGSENDVAGTMGAVDDALQKQKDHANQLYSAVQDLAGAQDRIDQASLAVADAQQKLAQAEEQVADKALLEQQAQDQLTAAIANVAEANVRLEQAQRSQAEARQKQANDVADAQAQLQRDALDEAEADKKVAQAQDAVNAAKSHDPTSDLVRATNALHDAQLRLVDSQVAVSDAQWQLNYLIQEGASARDIADAQRALEAANNAVADSTTSVADAQKKVNDSTSGKDLADATDALAAAIQNRDDVTRRTTEDQQKLSDLQDAAAHDTAYIDASAQVAQAQAGVDQANVDVRKSTDALHQIQGGSIERNLMQAQLNLRQAYLQLAQANVQMQVDTDALNGKFDTASDKVALLGAELVALGLQIGGPIGDDFITLGNKIGGAAGDLGVLDQNARNAGGAMGGASGQAGELGKRLDEVATNSGKPGQGGFLGWLGGISDWLGDHLISFIEFVQSMGDLLGITNTISGTVNIGNLANTVKGLGYHSMGGYFDQPTIGIFGEDGPEVILPLSKPTRMMELLQQTGVMDMINTRGLATTGAAAPTTTGGGGGGDYHHHEGDEFHLTAITNADPEDIVNEYVWSRRTRR